jgi:hypothetical protein
MSELATLLREDVRATEPSAAPDVMVPVRLGRRRLRNRRLLSGAAVVMVLAVGVAVPRLVAGEHGHDTHAVDTTAGGIRELMDQRMRAALGQPLDDLGPWSFTATTGAGVELPSSAYGARNLVLGFGTSAHHVTLTIAEARVVTANAVPPCPPPEEQKALPCTVLSESTDRLLVDRMSTAPDLTPPAGSRSTTAFVHEVFLRQGNRTTSVQEVVWEFDADAARQALDFEADALVALVTDPELDVPLPVQAAH